jgi:hypothetical protein
MMNADRIGDDHPEDLLDLAAGGAMNDAQLKELHQHLALCLPCATQLRMSGRSLSMIDRKVKASDVQLDRVAVYQVLHRARAASGPGRLRGARKWIPLGAGTFLVSSAALAATWWSVRQPSPMSPAVSPPVHAVAAAGTRVPFALPRDTDPPAFALGAEPSAASMPRPAERPLDGVRGRAERSSPAELFARARALRLGGNPTGALALYRRLQRGYADSRECHLSYLVVGRMWLDRDRADLAAPQFSRYLGTAGSASEEALVGRATAFGRMGRSSEEAADWQELLSDHPRSVYVSRARTRLDALGHMHQTPGSVAGPP